MHFLFVAVPAHGHVNPTLPLVRELIDRGHRVTYVTGPALVPTVKAAGAITRDLPWTVDPTALTRDTFSTTTFVGILDALLEAAAPELDGLVASASDADMVCFDATVAPVAAALAARLGVPAVSMIPSMAVNEHLPLHELLPPDFTPDNKALVSYAGKLHAFATAQGLPTPLAPMMVPPTPLTLVFVPSAFQLAADTFDPSYRFVGPSVEQAEQSEWQPPADGAPVLLVSLGTAFNDRPDVFTACAEAFDGTDWHVVMSTGRATVGPMPANVHAAPFVPQLAVLRHANAFVSHAGMNSIMESLANRVPLVTLPQVSEQALIGRRVRDLGLGAMVTDEVPTPQQLHDTVVQVSSDPAIRERLDWMAGEIAAAGGAKAAADAILALA